MLKIPMTIIYEQHTANVQGICYQWWVSFLIINSHPLPICTAIHFQTTRIQVYTEAALPHQRKKPRPFYINSNKNKTKEICKKQGDADESSSPPITSRKQTKI